MRLVANQDPMHITDCVKAYLKEKWAERGSPNKMKVTQSNLHYHSVNVYHLHSNDRNFR